MKNMLERAAAVLGILIFGGAVSGFADEAHLHIVPQALFKDLGGNGAATAGGTLTQNTDYDLDGDLGAGGTDLHVGVDLFGRIGRHRIIAGYSVGDHDGEDSISGGLNFDGTAFGGTADVETDIELTRRRLLYGFSFVNFSMVDLGILAGTDGYEVTTTLSQGAADQEVSIDSFAPALGLNLGIRPPAVPLRIYVEGVFSSGKISDVDTTLTDAYVSLDWYIIGLFGLEFGYRYYDLEADDTDIEATFEYRFAGPYAGLVFKF